MLNWIRSIFGLKTEFELTFSELKSLARQDMNGAKKTYELLNLLHQASSKKETDELVDALKKVNYASNTNGVFYFYFPIVSHILFYKPAYEKKILGILVGPNFANGCNKADEMITALQSAMDFKLQENSKYLTKEGKWWVKNVLPKMEEEIKREIKICWKEVDD